MIPKWPASDQENTWTSFSKVELRIKCWQNANSARICKGNKISLCHIIRLAISELSTENVLDEIVTNTQLKPNPTQTLTITERWLSHSSKCLRQTETADLVLEYKQKRYCVEVIPPAMSSCYFEELMFRNGFVKFRMVIRVLEKKICGGKDIKIKDIKKRYFIKDIKLCNSPARVHISLSCTIFTPTKPVLISKKEQFMQVSPIYRCQP